MAPSKARTAKRKNRTTQQVRKLKQKQKASSSSAATIDQLLVAARDNEQKGNLSDAIGNFEKVVHLKSGDAQLHGELAMLYMEAARPDDAERAFRAAVSISPDSGFEKYAYLAQLLGNTEEALQMARRGIDLMRAEILGVSPGDSERVAELRSYQASAHCAVAEICLGIIEDSNDPAVAQSLDVQVEKAVAEALSLSEEGSLSEIEAMLALANLRLSQARQEDARISMTHLLQRMERGLQMLESGDSSDATIVTALEELPPMEIRIAIGKQLLEVELWQEAVSVLASIMWECDFNVEVWYLLAVAYWKLGELSEARDALENTRTVLRNPDGYDGELEEDMIDKLYSELEKVSNATATQQPMRD